MEWPLIAQAVGPEITGASGWAGAGLLGLVLSVVLLKLLPDKDQRQAELVAAQRKEIADLVREHGLNVKELIGQHDKKLDAVVAAYNLHAREVREDNNERLKLVMEHCKAESEARTTENRSLNELMHKDMDALRAAIEGLSGHVETTKRENPRGRG